MTMRIRVDSTIITLPLLGKVAQDSTPFASTLFRTEAARSFCWGLLCQRLGCFAGSCWPKGRAHFGIYFGAGRRFPAPLFFCAPACTWRRAGEFTHIDRRMKSMAGLILRRRPPSDIMPRKGGQPIAWADFFLPSVSGSMLEVGC